MVTIFNLKKIKYMKKLLLVLTLMLTFSSIQAQVTELPPGLYTDSTKVEVKKYSPYIAAGLSMVNSGDFRTESYPSIEVGVMRDNIAFGVVVGRNYLDGLFTKNDNLNKYFYEGKLAFYTPLGSVDGYAVLGAGGYIDSNRNNVFFEYGVGVTKEFKGYSLFAQVTNWDGITYVTPGISINL